MACFRGTQSSALRTILKSMYFETQYATDCTPKKKKDSWGQWDKLYTHLDGHPSNSTIFTLDDRL